MKYLTHVVNAVVVIDGAIFTAETQSALATVVITTVDASRAIFARIKFLRAKLDFLFTICSCGVEMMVFKKDC